MTIILEYVPNKLGDLVFDKNEKISVRRALLLGLDVVSGVAQVHNISGGPITHNDINLSQYLVNSEGRVLLGDFNEMRYTGKYLVNPQSKVDFTHMKDTGLDHSGKKCLYYK